MDGLSTTESKKRSDSKLERRVPLATTCEDYCLVKTAGVKDSEMRTDRLNEAPQYFKVRESERACGFRRVGREMRCPSENESENRRQHYRIGEVYSSHFISSDFREGNRSYLRKKRKKYCLNGKWGLNFNFFA